MIKAARRAAKFFVGLMGTLVGLGFCVVSVTALELYLRMHGLIFPGTKFFGLDAYSVLTALTIISFFVVVINYNTFLRWLTFKS